MLTLDGMLRRWITRTVSKGVLAGLAVAMCFAAFVSLFGRAGEPGVVSQLRAAFFLLGIVGPPVFVIAGAREAASMAPQPSDRMKFAYAGAAGAWALALLAGCVPLVLRMEIAVMFLFGTLWAGTFALAMSGPVTVSALKKQDDERGPRRRRRRRPMRTMDAEEMRTIRDKAWKRLGK